MAITRVQLIHQYPSVNGTNYAFSSNNTAGNLIVVAISGAFVGGSYSFSISDTQGNTYVPLSKNTSSTTNGVRLQLFYAENIKSGPNSISYTYSGLSDVGFTAVEYSGIKTSGALDTEATPLLSSTNTATHTSNSFNPKDGSLIFAAFGDESSSPAPGTITGTGITIFQTDNTHYDSQGDNLSATAGSQTVSFNAANASSALWAVNVACFLRGNINATQSLSETIILVDTITKVRVTVKSLLESITIVDTITRLTAKILRDVITNVDSMVRSQSRRLSEVITLVDSVKRIGNKYLSDTIIVIDRITVPTAMKIFRETITVYDKSVSLFIALKGKILGKKTNTGTQTGTRLK